MHLHATQIQRHGGLEGLRDAGALQGALGRPAMTFGGEDLYPDLAAKAAALMHSLVLNHAFLDGNKRVGAHAAIVFLLANGLSFNSSSEDLVAVTLATAEGKVTAEALAIWFRQRCQTVLPE
jgi:death-on-curing protein